MVFPTETTEQCKNIILSEQAQFYDSCGVRMGDIDIAKDQNIVCKPKCRRAVHFLVDQIRLNCKDNKTILESLPEVEKNLNQCKSSATQRSRR
jgi:hypothetical protein